MNSLVGKTYYVKTFGCQMNLHDSERVEGLLEQNGCICVPEPEQADIVVFMTCCVRATPTSASMDKHRRW